ncbi:hypothetical protein Golomagni_02457 [Golovinomyces magnicellulatus]|nr:hypothetical protein Golomagni_02457 [Golovinomyces magnicellulatus]
MQDNLKIIHIPLDLYSVFLQPILQILLPYGGTVSQHLIESSAEIKHNFLNISVTSIECSIICHAPWADNIFLPFINQLSVDRDDKPLIYPETYTAFSLCTVNMDAGQRVIDLTAPLLIAGIPVYFITTCFTDFFLICSTDRPAVISKLTEHGFSFSDSESAYVPPAYYALCRPELSSNPLPTLVAELRDRALKTLKERDVVPSIDQDLSLVMCSGCEAPLRRWRYSSENGPVNPKSSHAASTWLSRTNSAFYTALISALANLPRFLSVTLALDDVPSLLIDKKLLRLFSDSIKGDFKTVLVPISLLSKLPAEMTGLVCGVASLLVKEICRLNAENGRKLTELSFLSTAKVGTVILGEDQSRKSLIALLSSLDEENKQEYQPVQ